MALRKNPDWEERPIPESPVVESPSSLHQDTVMIHGASQDTTQRRVVGQSANRVVAETSTPSGIVTSRTVVRDVVEARRRKVAQVTQIIWYVIGLFEALLALRLILKMLGANPNADFTQLIFALSRPLVVVFLGMFPNLASNGFELEPASIVAMVVYFLIGLGLVRLAWILYSEPREIS